MRYFVYRDAQIMGPFTREDLSQVQGLTADALVCPESEGVKDVDWKTPSQVEELAGLFKEGLGVKVAPAVEMGPAPDFYERLRDENRLLFEGFGFGGEWTSGAYEDPDVFRQWGVSMDSVSTRGEELESARIRAAALETSQKELREKLLRYERQQNEILDRLNLKDRALEEKERQMLVLQNRLPQLELALKAAEEELRVARGRPPAPQARGSAPAPEVAPPAPAASPFFQPPASEPLRPPSVPAVSQPPAPPSPFTVPPPVERAPQQAAPSAKARFEVPAAIKLKSSTREATGIAFTAPAPPRPAPPPIVPAPPAAPVSLTPAAPAPIAPTPMPPAATPLTGPGQAEPQSFTFSPEPAQPPETMVRNRSVEPPPSPPTLAGRTPSPQSLFPSAATPAPAVVDLGPASPVPPSTTPGQAAPFAMPQAGTPVPSLGPVGSLDTPRTTFRIANTPAPVAPVPMTAAPIPVPPVQPAATGPSVLKTPTETATGSVVPSEATLKRRKQSKTFLIVLGASFVGLLVAGVMFLRNPKDVIQLFTMSPKKRSPVDPEQMIAGTSLSQVRPISPKAGAEGPQAPVPPAASGPAGPSPATGPAAGPTAVQPAAPAAPQAAPATPAAAPATPPPGRDFIAEASLEAVDFAKKHPLPGGKGSLADWVRAKYLKQGDEELWDAGAVEAKIFDISYRYFKGGRGVKQEPVTYLFEVDLDKKTMKGRNGAAKQLLAAPAKKAKAPRKAPKRVKKAETDSDAEPRLDQEPLAPESVDDLLGPPSQAQPTGDLGGLE